MPIFVQHYIFSVLVFKQKLMTIHQSYFKFLKPFTRLQFTLLPYWIISASEVFQQHIEKIIEGSEWERNTEDDIIMWVWTLKKLDIHTKQVLNRIRTSGLKLKKDKCVFAASQLMFLRHITSGKEISTDSEKFRAIKDMLFPRFK